MGSSSSCTAGNTRYVDQSWLNSEQVGTVRVRSRRIGAFLGVHHYIAIDGIDNKWRVFEWGNGGTQGWKQFSAYATSSLYGQNCIASLGQHSVKKVYEIAKDCSYGACYGSNYNCNSWTQRVAARLGHNITVHWNCACVL